MRLAVIADTAHYQDDRGVLYALDPVVAQLDQLFSMFDAVMICAPLHRGSAPEGFSPYRSIHIQLHPVRPGGGSTVAAKVGLVARATEWWKSSRDVARAADALHFRCPSNVAGVGLVATWRWKRCRYAMYAGTWTGHEAESIGYRTQRWLLHRMPERSVVTVYGRRPEDAAHIVDFYSPSFSDRDWEADAPVVATKIDRLMGTNHRRAMRIVSIGSLTENKGHDVVVRAIALLARSGFEAYLQIVGRGPELDNLEKLIRELNVREVVTLTGHVPLAGVRELLRSADFAVVASRTEGYGKVALEAMVSGAVPVMAPVAVARLLTGDGERGLLVARTPEAIACGIRELADDPNRMASMIISGRAYSRVRTLESFRKDLGSLFERWWQS